MQQTILDYLELNCPLKYRIDLQSEDVLSKLTAGRPRLKRNREFLLSDSRTGSYFWNFVV